MSPTDPLREFEMAMGGDNDHRSAWMLDHEDDLRTWVRASRPASPPALPAPLDRLEEMARCTHDKRSGGNDYILCDHCGLMWDYRRETWHDGLTRLLLESLRNDRAAAPAVRAPREPDLQEFFQKLAASQRDLDPAAAKVLLDNLWELYDSTPVTALRAPGEGTPHEQSANVSALRPPDSAVHADVSAAGDVRVESRDAPDDQTSGQVGRPSSAPGLK